MTTQQLEDLRKTYLPGRFNEYRAALRDEVRRLGHTVTGNEVIKVLEARANDENRVVGDKPQGDDAKPEVATPDTPPQGTPLPEGGGKQDELPLPIPDGVKPELPKSDGDSKPDGEDGKPDDGDDDGKGGKSIPKGGLADAVKELNKRKEEAKRQEKEAKRRADEAERLKQEAAELERQIEEAMRKREEERKRKEEEAKGKQRHVKTDELVQTLKILGLAYLVGPAGSGKTSLAISACQQLFGVDPDDWKFNERFAQISFSPDTTSAEMIGRVDVNGVYHKSDTVRVFETGGLLLFDEIDNADASMLVKLNTAIANGQLATPAGIVRRHKDTVIVCTANTYGTGPDAMYVGRTRLDAATLDRFVCATIEVDYDTAMEKRIMTGLVDDREKRDELAKFVKAVRTAISKSKLRRVCSTRFVVNASKWLGDGNSVDFVKRKFFLGWSETERSSVVA